MNTYTKHPDRDVVRHDSDEHRDGQGNGTRRPKGITIVALLTCGLALFGLAGVALLHEDRHIVLGFPVPRLVDDLVIIVSCLVGLYCGIGFLRLKRRAFHVYLFLMGFSLVNLAADSISKIVNRGGQFGALSDRYAYYTNQLFGLTMALLIYLLIVCYVLKKRNYFTN